MRFEDLTDRQLKQVIKNYRLHLLEGMKGYTKFDREKLINLCKKMFDIDDEKIKPKVTEPVYFNFPQDKLKKREQPKTKKTVQPMKHEVVQDYLYSDSELEKMKKTLSDDKLTKKKSEEVDHLFDLLIRREEEILRKGNLTEEEKKILKNLKKKLGFKYMGEVYIWLNDNRSSVLSRNDDVIKRINKKIDDIEKRYYR
jgi:hypothetical protein